MFKTKIVDNFYDTPSLVRNLAISQNFHKRPGDYPGLRTLPINRIDRDFYISFVCKLLPLYFDLETQNIEWDVVTLFQWADKKFVTGWVHQDNVNYVQLLPTQSS